MAWHGREVKAKKKMSKRKETRQIAQSKRGKMGINNAMPCEATDLGREKPHKTYK